ncbi:MAG: hypothetical protein GY927_18395 [bacterium]|nr:hypothetical protein [bacterium]
MNNAKTRQTARGTKSAAHMSQTPPPFTLARPSAKSGRTAIPQASPSIKMSDSSTGLEMLLEIESQARKASTREELAFITANETRKLTGARQIFVFKAMKRMRLTNISGLPSIDRSAPLLQEIETIIEDFGRTIGNSKRHEFDVTPDPEGRTNSLDSYPFRHMLWVPFLTRSDKLSGGMLLAREQPWTKDDIVVADRLAETYQHALSLLMAESLKISRWKLKSLPRRKLLLGTLIVMLAAMAIPVPMSTLAPLEITAHNPFAVSATIEGVIEKILVNPGEKVAKDQPIVRFSNTILRNRLEVAQREVLVAKAQLKKASQLAFSNKQGRHELRMAMANLSLKKSELDFSLEMLERATIKAQQAGTAIYSDKQSLIGKPLALGERIMLIGDPRQIDLAIDVTVGDAILLKPGARAKIFLDTDPLHAREAVVAFSDYRAHPVAGGTLAFRVVALFTDTNKNLPRIGVRGTAQIFGEKTYLAMYLFRRPLSSIRQWIGL